jgi:transposase
VELTIIFERKVDMISVGIDVSKGKSKVCIMKPCGEVLVTPYDMFHTKSDLMNLVDTIKSYNDDVKVVLEATGQYHLPVVKILSDNDVFVSVVNPLRMKNFASQSIRKAKTDKIDSIYISQYGLTYWNSLESVKQSTDIYSELRTLSRQYDNTVSLIINAKNNFRTVINNVMPEIDTLLRDNNRTNRLTGFVEQYWHFDNITKQSEKRFINSVLSWGKKKGYHINETKAKEIYALAQNGIPVLPCTQSTKIVVLEAVRLIHELESTRNTILTQMIDFAKTLPEYSIVKEMPGIADVLATRIIAEIGDIHRFKNKHSLIAYAGIDAPPYQSGKFNATERHISKRGNSYLRKTGFEIMRSLLLHKPIGDPVYDFIIKKRNEGKCGKEAMIAGLNKFLRVYYGRVSELYESLYC